MSPELLDWVTALGVGATAALAGWPLTRWALHLAAGRDRKLTDAGAPRSEEARTAGPHPAETRSEDTPSAETETPAAVPHLPESAEPAAPPPDPPTGASPDATVDDEGLLRGGLWIGLLERLIIAGGVALGEPAVVGVVVAIKGLGRVPELLKSPTAGERFMIGSLASLGVALACGSIGRALIG